MRIDSAGRVVNVFICALLLLGSFGQLRAAPVAAALSQTIRGTRASAVVIDLTTGTTIAAVGPLIRGAPGSTIKPLLLTYALQHKIIRPETEVYCRRDLKIGERNLRCSHPADRVVFNAESALAESCNTWFAEMARRFSGPELEAALHDTHLPHASMEFASVQQRQLAVLGLQGVSASPPELARAYREMLMGLPAGGPVAIGLRASVEYGMADSAGVPGLMILGKTGTASDDGHTWTHGWFAGAMPGRFVIVVYVAQGNGGDAAKLAQKFFRTVNPVVPGGPSQ